MEVFSEAIFIGSSLVSSPIILKVQGEMSTWLIND